MPVIYVLFGIVFYLLFGLLAYLIATRKAHHPKGEWVMMIFWPIILICWIILSGINVFGNFLEYIFDVVMTWRDE